MGTCLICVQVVSLDDGATGYSLGRLSLLQVWRSLIRGADIAWWAPPDFPHSHCGSEQDQLQPLLHRVKEVSAGVPVVPLFSPAQRLHMYPQSLGKWSGEQIAVPIL